MKLFPILVNDIFIYNKFPIIPEIWYAILSEMYLFPLKFIYFKLFKLAKVEPIVSVK
jgi:hypothetical protein